MQTRESHGGGESWQLCVVFGVGSSSPAAAAHSLNFTGLHEVCPDGRRFQRYFRLASSRSCWRLAVRHQLIYWRSVSAVCVCLIQCIHPLWRRDGGGLRARHLDAGWLWLDTVGQRKEPKEKGDSSASLLSRPSRRPLKIRFLRDLSRVCVDFAWNLIGNAALDVRI